MYYSVSVESLLYISVLWLQLVLEPQSGLITFIKMPPLGLVVFHAIADDEEKPSRNCQSAIGCWRSS